MLFVVLSTTLKEPSCKGTVPLGVIGVEHGRRKGVSGKSIHTTVMEGFYFEVFVRFTHAPVINHRLRK